MREKTKNRIPHIISACFFAAAAISMVLALGMGDSYDLPGSQDVETISFAVCGDEERQKIAEEAAETFMRQNNCRVEVYCYPSESEMNRNILGQIAGGAGFDVFSVSRSLLMALKEKEQVVSLDDVYEERRQDGNIFYEAALEEGKIEGVQYAMPVGVMPYMLYYNQEFLSRLGMEDLQGILGNKQWDLPAFVEYVRRIWEKTQDAGAVIFLDWSAAEPFLRSGGGGWAFQDSRIVPDETLKAAGELLGEMVREGSVRCCDPGEYAGVKAQFASGEIPIMLGDLTMTRACSQSEFAWDIVPCPSPGSDFSNTNFDVPLIAAGSGRHTRLAKRFVSYYVSALGQKIRLERGECLMPSLDMVFYTSMGDVVFPEHSNYYFFAINNGYAMGRADISEEEREKVLALWETYVGEIT